jgi:hypothetical protein
MPKALGFHEGILQNWRGGPETLMSNSFLSAITSPGVLWMLVILGLCLWMLFRPHGREAPRILLLILVFAFQPFTQAVMNAENSSFPLKFDYFLYLIDKSLGVPAFLVARLFTEWQRSVLFVVYQSLSAVMIAWYGVSLKIKNGEPGRLLLAYLVTFVAGASLYLIVPACGPRHAFGSAFPLGDPSVSPVLVRLNYWPNAIPSLHLATALLFVFFAGKNRLLRCLAWMYLAGTTAATLAFEHYTIDLIVAVPFACFATLAARRRIRPALANLAAVLAWLLTIRSATPALVAYPTALRILAIATVVLAGFSMTTEREPENREVMQCVSMEVSN